MVVQRVKNTWIEDKEHFVRELRTGWEQEDKVIDALREAGLEVEVPERSIRNEFKDAQKYADQCDVYVVTAQGKRKIEIKSTRFPFTSRNDLPFPAMMVTTKKSWDEAKEKPYAVIIISQKTGAMITMSGKDRHAWSQRRIKDRNRNIEDSFLLAPLDKIYSFSLLVSALSV